MTKSLIEISPGNCGCCGIDFELAAVATIDRTDGRIHSVASGKYIVSDKAVEALNKLQIQYAILKEIESD